MTGTDEETVEATPAPALPHDPSDPENFPASGPGSLASIGQRAIARLIDTALVAVPLAIITVVWYSDTQGDDISVATPVWLAAIFFAIDLSYEVTMVRFYGQTVGKMAVRIRIVHITDGDHPGWSQSGIRYMVPGVADAIPVWFSGVLAVGVYLTAMFDPVHRGVHDKAAGTLVLRTR